MARAKNVTAANIASTITAGKEFTVIDVVDNLVERGIQVGDDTMRARLRGFEGLGFIERINRAPASYKASKEQIQQLNEYSDKLISEMRVRGKVMKKPVNSVEVVNKMVVGEVFDVAKMAKKCSLSLSAMRSRLYRFADMGLIEKCSRNPVTYVVTDELMPKLQQYAAIDCDKKHNEKGARIGGGKHMTWGNLFSGKPGQTICMLARD